MLLPWPENKDIKLYSNEYQQPLSVINRVLIRLLDNDRYLLDSIPLAVSELVVPSGNIGNAGKYLIVKNVGDDIADTFMVPLYKYI